MIEKTPMEFASVQQIVQHFLIHSGIGNEFGLYHDITRFVVFFLIFAIFLCILLYFSTKYIIFVWLFLHKKHRVWNRLLYFTRAVGLPTPEGNRRMVGVGKKSCIGYTTAGFPE